MREGRAGDYRNFIHKRIIGAASGFLGGGPLGAARGFITGGGRSRPQQQARPSVASRVTTSVGPFGGIFKRTRETFQARGQVRTGRFAEAEVQTTPSRAAAHAQNGGCPGCKSARATHTNKSGYYVQTQKGNPAAGGTWIPADSVCVPNRSRNAGNGRAVVRATSRIASFDRLARRVKKQMKAASR